MCWCDIYIEYTELSMATFSNLTFIIYIIAGESVGNISPSSSGT